MSRLSRGKRSKGFGAFAGSLTSVPLLQLQGAECPGADTGRPYRVSNIAEVRNARASLMFQLIAASGPQALCG